MEICLHHSVSDKNNYFGCYSLPYYDVSKATNTINKSVRGNESHAVGRATGGKGVAKPQAELRLGDGSWRAAGGWQAEGRAMAVA